MEVHNSYFVYCWGKNEVGELSLGHQRNENIPQPCKSINNIQIQQISSSRNHSAIVSMEGDLLLCGSGLHGKLGVETMNPNIIKFTKLQLQDNFKVKQVACGDYHTLCLLEDGRVLSWGGTLHKKTGQYSRTPGIVQGLSNIHIVFIDCGDFHSAALTNNGQLYTWGGGGMHYNKGQLGHGHRSDVEKPQQVKFNNDTQLRKISCGDYHMMALTINNELFGWGAGSYGECGYGEFMDSLIPKQVNVNFGQINNKDQDFIMQEIIDIKCGGRHSLLLTNNGLVFATGNNYHGQLGINNKENQFEFQLIHQLSNKKIIQIQAGWNHSLVLSDQGNIYSCGNGSNGQLGVGSEESHRSFQLISTLQGRSIQRIFTGGNHSWAVLDYLNPFLFNYQPPSPLKSVSNTPKQLSRNASASNTRGHSPNFTQSKNIQLQQTQNSNRQQNVEYILRICYSEVEYSHRFLQVKIDIKKKNLFQQFFKKYINELNQLELGLKFYNLKEDRDILEEFDNEIVNEYKGNDGSVLSFTGMMIFDLSHWDTNLVVNTINYDKLKCQNYASGDIYFIPEALIQSNPVQKQLVTWIQLFKNIFESQSIIMQAQYMELRPLSFK